MHSFLCFKTITLTLVACLFLQTDNLIAQTTAANNKPATSYTARPFIKGPSVWGVFEGRPPCMEIARQLHLTVSRECPKLKWRLTLYHDPVTKEPGTYQLEGSFFPEPGKPASGKWSIVKGMPSNPDALLYRLSLVKTDEYFYFLKGDDNVLFILDENKNFRVGNADFSYTLNRVRLEPMKPGE